MLRRHIRPGRPSCIPLLEVLLENRQGEGSKLPNAGGFLGKWKFLGAQENVQDSWGGSGVPVGGWRSSSVRQARHQVVQCRDCSGKSLEELQEIIHRLGLAVEPVLKEVGLLDQMGGEGWKQVQEHARQTLLGQTARGVHLAKKEKQHLRFAKPPIAVFHHHSLAFSETLALVLAMTFAMVALALMAVTPFKAALAEHAFLASTKTLEGTLEEVHGLHHLFGQRVLVEAIGPRCGLLQASCWKGFRFSIGTIIASHGSRCRRGWNHEIHPVQGDVSFQLAMRMEIRESRLAQCAQIAIQVGVLRHESGDLRPSLANALQDFLVGLESLLELHPSDFALEGDLQNMYSSHPCV
mmetsp:Transcript_69086/g.144280  ORF Transcript_69086/g.144280 Transcript_69086/m.144280 type:complete len:352 (-) Transcript_69086:77-1132(-)